MPLPRMFHEAIYVVYGFELEYLWRAAPCISQLSREDWLKESPLVANVYTKHSGNPAAYSDSGLPYRKDVHKDVIGVCATRSGCLTARQYVCYWRRLWTSMSTKSPLCRRVWFCSGARACPSCSALRRGSCLLGIQLFNGNGALASGNSDIKGASENLLAVQRK
jgi:hypothetical protein